MHITYYILLYKILLSLFELLTNNFHKNVNGGSKLTVYFTLDFRPTIIDVSLAVHNLLSIDTLFKNIT